MYRHGIQVSYAADHAERALAYANRACDLGLVEGCTDVALLYAEGGRDIAKATTLFAASCERGQPLACVHLAMLETDRMVPGSLAAKAFPLVDADCTRPPTRAQSPAYIWRTYTESSCEIAGRMLEAGRGVKQDVKRARATFARSCKSKETCDLALSPDGEECAPRSCRGTVEHSSSCVAGVCEPDLAIGADCRSATKPCTHGSFCDVRPSEAKCVQKKPLGAPCASSTECTYAYCEMKRCSQPPVHTN